MSEWRYRFDPEDVRHVGPVAEDFHEAFGLGPGAKTISPRDVAGVALTAIQGLDRIVRDREVELRRQSRRIAQLQAQNAALLERINAIERSLRRTTDDAGKDTVPVGQTGPGR